MPSNSIAVNGAPGFQGQVPGGYGDFGFTPSGLLWPAPGCWQVTGTIAGHSLTFVTLVKFVKALRNKSGA
jgi:hypothetical protein